ncbi:hypothetical protein HYQ46_010655 [Verticillium longisporum]|nr:hypothetical protein HYQ46_010655 [Verticillium longisporum]
MGQTRLPFYASCFPHASNCLEKAAGTPHLCPEVRTCRPNRQQSTLIFTQHIDPRLPILHAHDSLVHVATGT